MKLRRPLALAVLIAPVVGAGRGEKFGLRGAEQDAAALSPTTLEPVSEWRGPRVDAAVQRGLEYLRAQQLPATGAVALGADARGERPHVAVTALSALAWMSAGSTANRGPFQTEITRAIEYLLACTERAGDEHPGYVHDRQDSISRTHGHGLATMAFAEAYTLSPRSSLGRRLEETLRLAVDRIEASQGADGGWYYDPFRTAAQEGSVTVSMLQALRAAKNAGFDVDTSTVAAALRYLERSQITETGPDGGLPKDLGGFRYSLEDAKTSVALTAAALSTFHAAGRYDGKEIREGYDYIWRRLAIREEDVARGDRGAGSPFPFYERFYLSQALWQNPDRDEYARWAAREVPRLLDAQRPDGAWEDVRYDAGGRKIVARYGTSYATATNCLVLTLPNSALPIFTR